MAKPSKSKSPTTTNPLGTRSLPKNRPPTHLGEMLRQGFIIPLEITQTELAKRLDASYLRLNELINKRRSVTPEMAARVLGMSTEFWLDLQQN